MSGEMIIKFFVGCVVFLMTTVQVHAQSSIVFQTHITKALKAFCIDPIEDEFKDLQTGLSACFRKDYTQEQYSCIVSASRVGWHHIRLETNPDDNDEFSYFVEALDDAKKTCRGTLKYADVVQGCVDKAFSNKALLKGIYWFLDGSVDFDALADLSEEVRGYPQSMLDVVHLYEAPYLSASEPATIFKLVRD